MIGNLLKTLYSVSYFLQHYRGDINVIFILVTDNQERLLALVHRHIEVAMGYKNISNLDPNFLITTLFYSGVTMVEIRCIFHQPPFYMLCHLRSIKSTLLWIHEKRGDVSDPSLLSTWTLHPNGSCSSMLFLTSPGPMVVTQTSACQSS